MIRLRCGTILLDGFLAHLAERSLEHPDAAGRVVTLEYVRYLDGDRAGKQWARLGSTGAKGLPDDCLFDADGVALCMSVQTQQGLRDKWIDYREGELVVG